jgi:hypothetical protein
LQVNPCVRAAVPGLAMPRTQAISAARGARSLHEGRALRSGRLHLQPTHWRPRSCAGLPTQVREDLLDHGLLQDACDDLQLAAAVWAVLRRRLTSGDIVRPRTKPRRNGRR